MKRDGLRRLYDGRSLKYPHTVSIMIWADIPRYMIARDQAELRCHMDKLYDEHIKDLMIFDPVINFVFDQSGSKSYFDIHPPAEIMVHAGEGSH
jgi:hypothetical protein